MEFDANGSDPKRAISSSAFRTRLSAIARLVVLISLVNRDRWMMDGGDRLLRVMARVHADKALQWTLQMPDPPDGTPDFAGEAEDLHEMLGNLLDNAHQWPTSQVHVHVGVQSQGSAPMPVGAPWDGHPTAGSADLPDGHHRAQDPPQPRGA